MEMKEVMVGCVNGCAVNSTAASEEEMSTGNTVGDMDVIGGFCAVSGGFVSSSIGSSVSSGEAVMVVVSKGDGEDSVFLTILVEVVSTLLGVVKLIEIVLRLVDALGGETVVSKTEVSSVVDS